MELLRKYWLPLTAALVIAVLVLVCVIAGIKNSGRDLPTWKGIGTTDVPAYSDRTVSADSVPTDTFADNGTEATLP